MRAREWDPELRVFLSRDPLDFIDGFDVWNGFASDPLGNVDLLGMSAGQRWG
jgi:RHS repeat-associated protein